MWTRSGCNSLQLRYDRDDESDGQEEKKVERRSSPGGCQRRTSEIRVIGDPVLHERAAEILRRSTKALHKLARRMIRIMHEAPGVGLAATQLGVLQRVLVYDLDDEAQGPREPRA